MMASSSNSWRCWPSSAWHAIKSAEARSRLPPLWPKLQEDTRQALDDLHELARGIHPVVLSDRGLLEAIEGACSALANRAAHRDRPARARGAAAGGRRGRGLLPGVRGPSEHAEVRIGA